MSKIFYALGNAVLKLIGFNEQNVKSTMLNPDDLVIQRFLDGDERAFRQLYDKYAPPIYRVTSRFLGSSDQAEELVEEVFTMVRNDTASFDMSSMETFQSSLFGRVKILTQQKLKSQKNANDF